MLGAPSRATERDRGTGPAIAPPCSGLGQPPLPSPAHEPHAEKQIGGRGEMRTAKP